MTDNRTPVDEIARSLAVRIAAVVREETGASLKNPLAIADAVRVVLLAERAWADAAGTREDEARLDVESAKAAIASMADEFDRYAAHVEQAGGDRRLIGKAFSGHLRALLLRNLKRAAVPGVRYRKTAVPSVEGVGRDDGQITVTDGSGAVYAFDDSWEIKFETFGDLADKLTLPNRPRVDPPAPVEPVRP